MKILVLANLYPPLLAGTQDWRCQRVVEALRLRGHEVVVLTSNHGLNGIQLDADCKRRLWLNGVFDKPAVTGYSELLELEQNNQTALREEMEAFAPDLTYVWSLHGLSKSLLITLNRIGAPYAFDIADRWLIELGQDAWLRWWNAAKVPLAHKLMRGGLEVGKQRDRLDAGTPTRCTPGVDRMPAIFDRDAASAVDVEANSIPDFRLSRLYFSSESLKGATASAGFRVSHAGVIHPGLQTEIFHGQVKPALGKVAKLLCAAPLAKESGLLTALEALRVLRDGNCKCTLSLYGNGSSEHIAQLRSFVIRYQLPVDFKSVANWDKEMPGVYRAHDILLHTTERGEAHLGAPLEALACGLPVISAATEVATELLRDGENALIFPPGDAAGLVAGVERLLSDGELRQTLAATGQGEVCARFNQSTVTDEIENFLTDTVAIWQRE